jgi:hypothetical protein
MCRRAQQNNRHADTGREVTSVWWADSERAKQGGREQLDHDRSAQPLPLSTHGKGLCRGADDRPETWPTDKFRKSIEVDLGH